MTNPAMRTPAAATIPTLDTLGARLALVRWHMGWNIREAERECGISQNTWANWEKKGSRPRDFIEVIEKITERTGVNPYWLIGPQFGGNVTAIDTAKNTKRRTLDYGGVVSPIRALRPAS